MVKSIWPPMCICGPNHIAIACVPRIANTAIKYAVLTSLGHSLGERAKSYRKHPALRLCYANKAITENYKVYACVRDPFDRLLSVGAGGVIEDMNPEMSFDAFVIEYMTPEILQTDRHAAPQSDFIPDQAIILRYEMIKDDWAKIKKVWPGLVNLKLINASMRGDVQEYKTPELKQKCRELYAIDYQRFGYV